MTTTRVTLPGDIVVRAGGELDRDRSDRPDWGIYADACWAGWPGVVLDWPDFGVPENDENAVVAIVEAFARCRRGEDVLVGCRGGTGRTGTLLAGLAVAAGVPAHLAVKWVRTHYRTNAVETREQAVSRLHAAFPPRLELGD